MRPAPRSNHHFLQNVAPARPYHRLSRTFGKNRTATAPRPHGSRHGHEGVEPMPLAVMGCIVNGPGESKVANIGISLPGTGEAPRCPVYIDGVKTVTLEGTYDELAIAFQALVDNYITTRYPRKSVAMETAR